MFNKTSREVENKHWKVSCIDSECDSDNSEKQSCHYSHKTVTAVITICLDVARFAAFFTFLFSNVLLPLIKAN